MTTISQIVAQKTSDLSYAELDALTLDRCKYLLLDFLAMVIRGAKSESSVPVHRLLENKTGAGGFTPVIGTKLKSDPAYSAMAMGIASHSLELDDVVNSASLHPGVVIMPTVISMGYEFDVNPERILSAIVSGYELMVKLGIALDPSKHYARGFHPTATCGAFGSALAAAKVLDLNSEQMANALGIAGSQAAGSMEFLADGSFTKRFHAGWAALSGVNAALLAKEGFTGPSSIIEGKSGFLNSYSSSPDADKVLEAWGVPFEVMNTSIKPHACCRYKQGSIDCILSMLNKHTIEKENIDQIEVAILKAGKGLVAIPEEHKKNPKSIVDAQFSMPFGAAVALSKGRAFLDEYCLENINDSEIQNLMAKVICVDDDEIEKDFPRKWPANVSIRMLDGSTMNEKIEFPKGDPENPLGWEEMIEKFSNLTKSCINEETAEKVITLVLGFEKQKSVRPLVDLLGN